MQHLAVRADQLVKRFGATVALDGVSLEVETGSVCAMLGRNGAGKTSAIRILTTLSRPTSGSAVVAGFDVLRDPRQVRDRIGVVGQSTSMDELLSGRDNLEIIGRLYHLGPARSRQTAADLLERFQLSDAAHRLVKTYSGGMRRRLDLAASLIVEPQVLFLDEPTTGLDPIARVNIWSAVRDLVAGGTTVLLTTQQLEEADQLADSIIVIDHGKVVANGTPAELKRQFGTGRIEVIMHSEADLPPVQEAIRSALGVTADVSRLTVSADAVNGVDSLAELITELRRRHISVEDIGLHRPSLDDVFGQVTAPGAQDLATTSAGASR